MTTDWRAKLREKGYRLTPQRELILDAVDTLGHATPDEVLAEVRTTVVGGQRLHRLPHPRGARGARPGPARPPQSDRAPTYHSVRDHEHFHLVCRNCHKVISVGPDVLDPLLARLDDEHGFEADVGHLTVFGTLPGLLRTRLMTSPLLDLPGAVAGDGVDAPVAAHYGSFNREQRALESGDGFVDLSHRDVVRIEGPDRLTWLHSLTTQHLERWPRRRPRRRWSSSPQGHVEHAFVGTDDGTAFTLHTEPGPGRGARRVPRADAVHDARRGHRRDRRATPSPGARRAGEADDRYELVPRDQLAAYAEAAGPPPGCGRSRRCGSRAASRGSASTPTTARSPTRSAGSARPCTWTRAATAARRPSPGCTPSAGRRAG